MSRSIRINIKCEYKISQNQDPIIQNMGRIVKHNDIIVGQQNPSLSRCEVEILNILRKTRNLFITRNNTSNWKTWTSSISWFPQGRPGINHARYSKNAFKFSIWKFSIIELYIKSSHWLFLCIKFDTVSITTGYSKIYVLKLYFSFYVFYFHYFLIIIWIFKQAFYRTAKLSRSTICFIYYI